MSKTLKDKIKIKDNYTVICIIILWKFGIKTFQKQKKEKGKRKKMLKMIFEFNSKREIKKI
jgi:hypothetical protein